MAGQAREVPPVNSIDETYALVGDGGDPTRGIGKGGPEPRTLGSSSSSQSMTWTSYWRAQKVSAAPFSR